MSSWTRGAGRTRVTPPQKKKSGKIFTDNYHVKFRIFGNFNHNSIPPYAIAVLWNWATLPNAFQDVWIQVYLGHDYHLLGSRDHYRARDHLIAVDGHHSPGIISKRCSIYCNQVTTSSRFQVIRPQTYRGHALDLSRSRSFIDYVAIRFAICHFIFHSNRFRDIRPQQW